MAMTLQGIITDPIAITIPSKAGPIQGYTE